MVRMEELTVVTIFFESCCFQIGHGHNLTKIEQSIRHNGPP